MKSGYLSIIKCFLASMGVGIWSKLSSQEGGIAGNPLLHMGAIVQD